MRSYTFLFSKLIKVILIAMAFAMAISASAYTTDGPYNTHSDINCVGTPPASSQFTVGWDPVPTATTYNAISDNGNTEAYGVSNPAFTDTNPYFGVVYLIYANTETPSSPTFIQGDASGAWGTGEWVHTPMDTCDATILVYEVNGSGGAWLINPENQGYQTNTVHPASSGTTYSISNIIPPNGKTVQSVTSSDGTGSTLNITPGQTKSFTITYDTPQTIQSSVAIKANGQDGPITISSGSAITLSWESIGVIANSCAFTSPISSSVTDDGSEGPHNSGHVLYPSTSGTTYRIQCNSVNGPVSDTVVVTLATASSSVNITASGDGTTFVDGPLYLSSSQNFWYKWASSGSLTGCSIGAPVNSGVALSGTAGPYGSSHAHSPTIAGTTYTITCNVSGGGQVTDSVFAQRALPAPTLSGNTGSCGTASVALSWTAVSGATSYKVFRDGGATPIYSGSNTTYVDGSLTPGSSHAYTVKASNASGDSLASNTITRTAATSCGLSVDLKGRLGGAGGAYGDGPLTISSGSNVDLNWTSVGVATCAATGGWSGSKSANGGETRGPLSSNTSYTLTCYDSSGNSTSDSITVNISAGTPPSAPATVSAVTGSCGAQINVSWSAVSGATSYEVLRSATSGGTYTVIANGITGTSYTNASGLTSGTTYYYKVRAVNAGGSSANSTSTGSAVASTACGSNPLPNLTATPGACIVSPATTGTINLSWATAGANSYTVRRNGVNIYIGGATSMADNNRVAGQTYTYSVTAAFPSGSPASTISPNVQAVAPSACATINATSNRSGTTWSIPGATPFSGSYPSQAHSISPAVGGTSYTLSPSALSGYSVAVSNSISGNSPTATVLPGGTATFTITYTASPFNYSLSAPAAVSLVQGDSNINSSIIKTLLGGVAEPVNLSVTGLPSGVSVSSYPNQGCSPSCTGFISFSASSGATPGNYNVTINGLSTGTGLAKQTTLPISVNATASGTTNLSCSPTAPKVGQTVTCSANATPPPCTYVWTGDVPSPAPTTDSFSTIYQTTGTKTIQVTASCNGSNPVNDSIPFFVGVDPNFQEF